MNDQLSALIDGEFDIDNAEHLIMAAKSTGAVSKCWSEYHLIGDILRGDASMTLDFQSRVMQALESETLSAPVFSAPIFSDPISTKPEVVASIFQAPKNLPKSTLIKTMPIWSVAASVAAVMFVGYMVLQQNVVTNELAPIEIAQSVPMEYIQAHQDAAPSNAAYYMQTVNFTEPAHQ